MIDAKLFKKPAANALTRLRIEARRKHRLTYDCMAAKVHGNRVECAKGHTFPSPGPGQARGLRLESVLTGRSSRVCQGCKDYDGEVTE